MTEVPFIDLQKQLADEFEAKRADEETDEEFGEALLEFFLKSERLRHRISDADPRRAAVDRRTLQRLANPDALGPAHSFAEVTFRRIVKDRAEAADYVARRVAEQSAVQSKRAQSERPKDVFTQLMDECVRANPKISEKHLIQRFLDHEDFDVVGDEIWHLDTRDAIPVSRLRSRLSDAKKRLNRKDSGHPG